MSSDFGRAPEIVAIPTMYMRNRPRLQANLARLSSLFPGKVTEQPLFHSEDYSKSLEDGVPLALWKQGNENSGRVPPCVRRNGRPYQIGPGEG